MMRVVAGIYAGHCAGVVPTCRSGFDRRRPAVLEAMSAADVDLFGAFTGTLRDQAGAAGAVRLTADEVFTELNHSLPRGIGRSDAGHHRRSGRTGAGSGTVYRSAVRCPARG